MSACVCAVEESRVTEGKGRRCENWRILRASCKNVQAEGTTSKTTDFASVLQEEGTTSKTTGEGKTGNGMHMQRWAAHSHGILQAKGDGEKNAARVAMKRRRESTHQDIRGELALVEHEVPQQLQRRKERPGGWGSRCSIWKRLTIPGCECQGKRGIEEAVVVLVGDEVGNSSGCAWAVATGSFWWIFWRPWADFSDVVQRGVGRCETPWVC